MATIVLAIILRQNKHQPRNHLMSLMPQGFFVSDAAKCSNRMRLTSSITSG